MKNKKKVITLITVLASTALVAGVTAGVVSFVGDEKSQMTFSDGSFSMTLGGTNGNVSVENLKTSNVVAKTAESNNVSFDYKNAQVVSNKVGKILAGGFYKNHDPIHNMASITVVSNAATSDAKLYYGKTSSYMPDFVDLAQAATPVTSVSGANFFKIVATNDVEIESIVINFGCETKDYGDLFFNSTGNPVPEAYKFTYNSLINKYYMSRNSGYASVTKAIVPDYWDDGVNGQAPVTILGDGSSTGCFEGNSSLQEVYLPETIKEFTAYMFYTANQVKEFTLPLDLSTTRSNPLPKSNLETLNIHSKNLTAYSTFISSSNTPKLSRINVSYDVESLPAIINSWTGLNLTVYYEGTTAEWNTLANATSIWKDVPGDVICSDTTLGTISLHFEGATLGSDVDSKTISTVIGKSIADFGSPLWTEGGKKFVGWYDEAVGGNKISFPYEVTGDADIYAHFEDYGAGVSFENPIIVTMDHSYTYSTDEIKSVGYFKYTATADEVITAKVTSAASAFSNYVYLKAYDSDKNEISVQRTNSTAAEVSKASQPTTYGINNPLKLRLTAGETVYVTVDGNNTSRVGELTVYFDYVSGSADYTTCSSFTNNFGGFLKRYGVTWVKTTPATTGTYLFTGIASAWAGATMCHFEDGVYVADTTGSTLNLSTSEKKVLLDLTAGVTYYFGFTANSDETEFSFTLTDELDPGMTKATAIGMTVDGSSETVGYNSNFPKVWYKFTASSAAKYRLVISEGTIYTSGNSRPLFAVEDETGNPINMEAGRTASDKVINVSSGTYYIAITTSSSAKDFDFSVQSIGVEYTVKVYANGPDTEPTSTQVVDENASYLLDDPVYQSNGYTYYTGFEGWFTDAALTVPFTSGDAITGNTNIYAKLTGKYRSDLFNLIDTLYSGCFENMTSGAYHWVSDESGKIVSTNDGVSSTSSQMDLVAKKAINISFDYQVSSEKNSDKFYVYTKPTVEGSRTAIINGVSGFDPDVTGSQSVTLEAGNVIQFIYQKDSSLNKGTDKVYLSNFSISEASAVQLTYDFQDEVTPNEVVDVLSGQAITKISDPTREGYRFGGWYTQPLGAGDAFDFASGISANTTIYAYWIETVSLTIYADGPDAAATEVRVVDKGASVTLYTLNSTYYSGFQGWFSNPELTDSLGGLECTFTVSSNMSAYAKHNGKYRMDVFNDIDAAYPGIFSGIGGSTNARHWSYNEGLFVSSGADSSTSELTLTLAVDTVVSFDWTISSEPGWDKGSIFYEVSGTRTYIANEVSGENNGSFSSTLTAGTVITFRYTKDSSTRAGLDCLKVSNATFVAA